MGDPDGTRPRVATITVGTNERRWLETCLGSLLDSDTTDLELAVYYVDNASQDGSGAFVRERFAQVRITENPKNYGFSRANNIGMACALADGADYVFLVNPDTKSPRGLIRGLVTFMQTWRGYGIVGPVQYNYEETGDGLNAYNDWSTLALRIGERHALAGDWPDLPSPASPGQGRAPNTLEHAYVQGSALFVRTEVLRRIGLFDEVFHTYYEEVDLCRRARSAGYRVALLLDHGIQHKGGGGSGRGRYRRVHMRRNRYYYLLTDIDCPLRTTIRLTARWLWQDLHGDSVGGDTTPVVGTIETVYAVGWLARHTPQVIARRRQLRRLRRIAADAPAEAWTATDGGRTAPGRAG